MANLQPLIDERDQQELVGQLKKLILAYCPEWKDLSALELDLNANALIHIFARMMEISIQRLNKVPEKNLLSFLDMVGISLAPPRVAKTPLVFTMAQGASQYGFIPAGAQVASAPLKDGTTVVFETEKDLTVILPKLVKAISLNPKTDRWKDHSPAFFKNNPNQTAEEIFQGKDLVAHQLWLGHQKLFGLKEPATITLNVTLESDNLQQLEAAKWQVKWFCYTDGIKTPLTPEESDGNSGAVNLLRSGQITFLKLSGISAQTITGIEASEVRSWTNHWIVAELNRPITGNVKNNLPRIKNITAAVNIDGTGVTGAGTIASQGQNLIKGTKTLFTELKSGDTITIIAKNQKRKVTGIISDVFLTVDTPFDPELPEGTSFIYLTGSVSQTINFTPPVLPDLAFYNIIPIDLTKNFYPFGERPKKYNDSFYFASKEIFSKPGAEVNIDIAIAGGEDTPAPDQVVLCWEYFNGKSWQPMAGDDTIKFVDSTENFKITGKQVTFTCPAMEATKVNGEENYWVRVRMIGGNYGAEVSYRERTVDGKYWVVDKQIRIPDDSEEGYHYQALNGEATEWVALPATFKPPIINSFKISYQLPVKPENLETVLTYNSFIYQDQTKNIQELQHPDGALGKPFKPFQPAPEPDIQPMLFLAFDQDIGALPVTMFFPLQADFFQFQYNLVFDSSELRMNSTQVQLNSIDNFKAGITLEFRNTVQGIEKRQIERIDPRTNTVYWDNGLTVNYDKEGSFIRKVWECVRAPIINDTCAELKNIAGLKAGDGVEFSNSAGEKESRVITKIDERINRVYWNEGLASNYSQEESGYYIASDTPVWECHRGPIIDDTSAKLKNAAGLKVGDWVEFSNSFGEVENREITMIDDRLNLIYWKDGLKHNYNQEDSRISIANTPPVVAWEYWTGEKWSALSVEDASRGFTKRGLIQFLAPDDLKKQYLFGEESYWIRARLEEGAYEVVPYVNTIYTNTVWAHNLITVRNEILGSSNGLPNQVFKFASAPVLSGQVVMVRETALTESERKIIYREEGPDAITEVKDQAGNIVELWVRWHEVNNFNFSGAGSRHYKLDRINGLISFGDMIYGMVPPVGKDNIKCSHYQSGGGVKGNVRPGTIIKLRTTYPYIDSVTNPEVADGGSEPEDLLRVKIRGPQSIKNRDRAVTFEDYEWLVREASTKVAKVKCLPTTDSRLRFEPGRVTVIIVPDSDDPRPFPSQELLGEIEEYLTQRAPSDIVAASQRIKLMGPGYVRVGVRAWIQFKSISNAKTIEGRVIENLKKFFHPLYGGPEKKGWDFGRNVYRSEVYAVIEDTEGVDFVKKIALEGSVQSFTLRLTDSFIPNTTFPRLSSVQQQTDIGTITLGLADTLAENVPTEILNVIGFREGDTITLHNNSDRIDFLIKTITDNVLVCEPHFDIKGLDIPGKDSIVETIDGSIQSYLVKEVKEYEGIYSLAIAVIQNDTTLALIHRDDSFKKVMGLEIECVSTDVIFLWDNDLVYTGTHLINKDEQVQEEVQEPLLPVKEEVQEPLLPVVQRVSEVSTYERHQDYYYYPERTGIQFDFTGIGGHLLEMGAATTKVPLVYPPIYYWGYYWYPYNAGIQIDFTGIGGHLLEQSPVTAKLPLVYPFLYYLGYYWYPYNAGIQIDFTGIGGHLLEQSAETTKIPTVVYPYLYYRGHYWYPYSTGIQVDFTGVGGHLLEQSPETTKIPTVVYPYLYYWGYYWFLYGAGIQADFTGIGGQLLG